METYWVPGVNNLGRFGRWAFAEFNKMIEQTLRKKANGHASDKI
jgi:type III restriction enzyme